jgi:8-oxo-dGTP diphosphatase
METRFEISAGGVVYKRINDSYNFLLIAVKNGQVWTLPKGLVEKGEKPESAALREVKEEAGVEGRVESFLDKIELWFYSNEEGQRVRHHKIVYYYLIEYQFGDPSMHDFEVVDVQWFGEDEALKIASYDKDRKVLEKAINYLRSQQNA